MAPNKGPSGFAIAWDQALNWWKKAKKKLSREVRQAGVWQGERAAAKLSPLQSTVWLTLLTSFYFFAVSLCFLPLSPTTMTGLRLFLLQVPCLLVNNTEGRQVLGWGNMASV